MNERRIHTRTSMGHRVKIAHPAFGDLVTMTQDMSVGGFFIEMVDVALPEVGSIVMVQLLDTEIIAAPKAFKVMRVTDLGIGVAFKD